MAIIGVILLFSGCLAFTMTWNAEPRDTKSAVFGLLLVLGGGMMAIGGSSPQGLAFSNPTQVLAGSIISVISCIFLYKPLCRILKEKMRDNKKSYQMNLIGFYNDLAEKGFDHCNTDEARTAAVQIAKKRMLKYKDITALYAQAKELASARSRKDESSD